MKFEALMSLKIQGGGLTELGEMQRMRGLLHAVSKVMNYSL